MDPETTAAMPAPVEYDVLRLAGRCSNGFEADAGSLFHAVPNGKWVALCTAKPGKRSAGWSSHAGEVVTCPRCRKALKLPPISLERAAAVLAAAGFVPDGATRAKTVRIPTSRAPVFGGTGGEVRTLGGRARFRLPDTEVRATVGAQTVCLYRREGRGVVYLGEGNYRTKDFTAEQLQAALQASAR